jgi:hypothetical protein
VPDRAAGRTRRHFVSMVTPARLRRPRDWRALTRRKWVSKSGSRREGIEARGDRGEKGPRREGPEARRARGEKGPRREGPEGRRARGEKGPRKGGRSRKKCRDRRHLGPARRVARDAPPEEDPKPDFPGRWRERASTPWSGRSRPHVSLPAHVRHWVAKAAPDNTTTSHAWPKITLNSNPPLPAQEERKPMKRRIRPAVTWVRLHPKRRHALRVPCGLTARRRLATGRPDHARHLSRCGIGRHPPQHRHE